MFTYVYYPARTVCAVKLRGAEQRKWQCEYLPPYTALSVFSLLLLTYTAPLQHAPPPHLYTTTSIACPVNHGPFFAAHPTALAGHSGRRKKCLLAVFVLNKYR